MFPYDSALVDAVAANPQTIPDVLRMQQSIQDTCADADGLKWFNGLYLHVTQAVQARVEAGDFANPAWMAALDVEFACFYFNALRASLSGQPAPDCWQAVFDRRNQTAVARIQFALAGMNAHINNDLPQAVVAACQAASTLPAHGTDQYDDFTALNSTLDSLVEEAKQTLNVRLPGDALPPVTNLEDTMAAWSMTAARESAWNNAELLAHLAGFACLRDCFLDTLDGFTALAGKTLLVPVP